MKLQSKIFFCIIVSSLILVGCSNKINQTGSWLVSSDSTMVPTYFDSIRDTAKVSSSQVNTGLATGGSDSYVLGKVPWTEADMLIEFTGLDSVASAQTILSSTITLYRTSYLMQPAGMDIHGLQLAGFTLDTLWYNTTVTWDSLNVVGYGSRNIITSSQIGDTSIVIQLDSTTVRDWALSLTDSSYRNFGMIIKPQNSEGILSVYSSGYGVSGYIPECTVICIKNGVLDTVTSTSSYAAAVAQTSIETFAPAGPYRFVQAGTGENENLVFDLSRIPKYSIINSATLTLYSDTVNQARYTVNYHSDSLEAYYVSDPTTWAYSTAYPAIGFPSGNQCVFNVSLIVQHMLNAQNYGFLIAHYFALDNVDTRFVYDENAPDSLKPRLTITYTPTSKR